MTLYLLFITLKHDTFLCYLFRPILCFIVQWFFSENLLEAQLYKLNFCLTCLQKRPDWFFKKSGLLLNKNKIVNLIVIYAEMPHTLACIFRWSVKRGFTINLKEPCKGLWGLTNPIQQTWMNWNHRKMCAVGTGECYFNILILLHSFGCNYSIFLSKTKWLINKVIAWLCSIVSILMELILMSIKSL